MQMHSNNEWTEREREEKKMSKESAWATPINKELWNWIFEKEGVPKPCIYHNT